MDSIIATQHTARRTAALSDAEYRVIVREQLLKEKNKANARGHEMGRSKHMPGGASATCVKCGGVIWVSDDGTVRPLRRRCPADVDEKKDPARKRLPEDV